MCMIDDCDERFRAYREISRRAIKSHKCSECCRAISPGEQYFVFSGLYDNWSTYKICAHCRIVCRWLEDNCGGFLHSGVEEDIRQHFEEYGGMDLGRLAVGMGHGWKFHRYISKLPEMPRSIEALVHGRKLE